MPRAFSISAEAIAAERKRVGDDLERFDVGRVIQLDELELDLPRAIAEVHHGVQTGIPIVQVARDLAGSLLGLVP